MSDWWTAKCKKCGADLAIRPSEAGPDRIDLGGMGSVANPVKCSVCDFKNQFDYGDLQLAARKDDPTLPE
jgi:hypothetical protein